MMRRAWIRRGARLVTHHPLRALLLALALAGAGAALAAELKLKSSYTALLPQGSPMVRELEQARRHAGGTAELVIAIDRGDDPARGLALARRVVKRLERSPAVRWARAELPTEFFSEGRLWLLPAGQLRDLRQGVGQVVARRKARANPMFVDLEQDDEQAAPAADPLADLRRLERRHAAAAPRGELVTSDGRYQLVVVKPRASAAELAQGQRTLATIQREVQAAQQPGQQLKVRYAGSLVASQQENKRISRDLSLASLLALVLTVGLITITTRRLSAVLVIGLPLVAGLCATLGAASLLFGQLNLVSGFLVAALVGLGIDFGIHLYLRFLDRLPAGASPRQAMTQAVEQTFGPCLTSALTTAVAFLALAASSFRGFSEYGLIAGVGVLLTLAVTFIALPPLGLLLTRGRAVGRAGQRRLRRARRLARPLVYAMLACGLGFVALSATRVDQLRFHNNFRALKGDAPELAFAEYIEGELGGSLSPAVIMVDDFQQLRRAHQLVQRRMEANTPPSAVGRVLSLASLVPDQVPLRRALLDGLRADLRLVLRQAELSEQDRRKVRQLVRLTSTRPWAAEQVPVAFRQRLVGLDQPGGAKHFLLAWPAEQLYEDRAIERWAGELEAIRGELSAVGVSALVLDENRLAARVLQLIRAEGPRVLLLSALGVLAVLLLDFRRLDRVALVGGSVVCGLVAMLGAMVLWDVQLNLFNVVVLPSVLGIGIDNAVHLQHARARLGRGSIVRVVSTAGRAALLSSMTTAMGFGAAIIAHHGGVRQMGVLALLGIGCTFVATTVLFPVLVQALDSFPRPRGGLPVQPAPVPVIRAVRF